MSLPGKITFVGAGNMASAIIAGLLRANLVSASQITAVDLAQGALDKLSAAHGIHTTASTAEGVAGAAIVVLAVKPQVVQAVLPEVTKGIGRDALVVSILAGVSCATLEAGLPAGTRVVRSMPNTPSLVRRGATALAAGTHAKRADLDAATTLFDAVGLTVEVPERSLDAVTGLSGSGPAYVFLFLEALADGGVKEGLPRDVALRLAAQTVLGAATRKRPSSSVSRAPGNCAAARSASSCIAWPRRARSSGSSPGKHGTPRPPPRLSSRGGAGAKVARPAASSSVLRCVSMIAVASRHCEPG